MFGYTLMTAGLARIIEICFLPSPSIPQPPGMVMSTTDDEINSDHTLHEERPALQQSKKEKTIWAFRHVPPFVRNFFLRWLPLLNRIQLLVSSGWVIFLKYPCGD